MSNDIIKGLGFHHIALKANDFEKSVKFYKALGMKEIVGWGKDENSVVMLDMGVLWGNGICYTRLIVLMEDTGKN